MRLTPILALTFAGLFAFDTASAAPGTFPDRKIDIDMVQAEIRSVFEIFGQVANREIVLDPCVHGTIDLRLRNTPVSLVLDAIAAKLRLTYEDDGSSLHVHCMDDDAGATTAARVSLALESATLAEAADSLAKAANLDGVDYRATTRPKVHLTVERVRLGTALAVLADESGLKLAVAKKKLVVSD